MDSLVLGPDQVGDAGDTKLEDHQSGSEIDQAGGEEHDTWACTFMPGLVGCDQLARLGCGGLFLARRALVRVLAVLCGWHSVVRSKSCAKTCGCRRGWFWDVNAVTFGVVISRSRRLL